MNILIGTRRRTANIIAITVPINPVMTIGVLCSLSANFSAAAEVYPYPTAAPIEDISTIQPRAVLPKKGATNEITNVKIIAWAGVLYVGCSSPNHPGRTFSSDME